MDLAGRRVLITGANRGLGAAFVEAALARRADTVYAAARHPASLPQFSDPAKVIPVRLDVTDQDAMVAAAKEAADVDLLISNAGLPQIHAVVATLLDLGGVCALSAGCGRPASGV
jgi:NAD(P)-dependent dehydrogenase (short-subunit alcohol dehydrogenase family)